MADNTYEKEKYSNSNKELREYVKRIESERREQGRTLEESYQRIAGISLSLSLSTLHFQPFTRLDSTRFDIYL